MIYPCRESELEPIFHLLKSVYPLNVLPESPCILLIDYIFDNILDCQYSKFYLKTPNWTFYTIYNMKEWYFGSGK